MLPTSLFVSAPPSQLSRVSPTSPVGQRGKFSNFKEVKLTFYASSVLLFCYYLPQCRYCTVQLVLLPWPAAMQTSIRRNKCAVAATAAFCNPAMAVCQSECGWDRERGAKSMGVYLGSPSLTPLFSRICGLGLWYNLLGTFLECSDFHVLNIFYRIIFSHDPYGMGMVWYG